MTEPKFTPGPWVAVYRGDYGEGAEGDVHQKELYDVDPFDSGFMRGEFKWADAQLIAAAPDLYEALVNVLSEISSVLEDEEHYFGTTERFDQARAALAKARGDSEKTIRGGE